jgi:PAS domain S-box-containing protein
MAYNSHIFVSRENSVTDDKTTAQLLQEIETLRARLAAREQDAIGEELRASEERYRALAEHSPVGIWQVNTDGYTVYANPAMRTLLEIGEQDEIAGLHHDNFLILDQAAREQVSALREQGVSSSYETKLKGIHGAIRDVIVFGSPILSADGSLQGTIGTVLDITDRRHIEEELRASEERHRALAEHSPVGIWQIGPNGNTLYANPAMLALLGVAHMEEIGSRAESPFFTPGSLATIANELDKRWKGLASTYEVELVRKDGERRHVIASGAPVLAGDGTLRYSIASFVDVTESKQIEAALRKSESRFRLLAENVMDGFWMGETCANGCRVLYVNPAFERIFGVTSEEMLESEGAWGHLLHPEDRDRVVATMQAFSQGKADYSIEYRIVRADGEVRWIFARASTVRDEENGALHVIGIAQDITERKHTEEELRQRASQLALVNRVASQIAAVLDLDTLMEQAAALTQTTFGYQHVGLFLLDPAQKMLVMQAKAGEYADHFPLDHRRQLGKGIVGWVAQHGETLLANDVSFEPRYINPFLPDEIIRAELSVPIRVEGKVVGVFDVQSQETGAFDEADVLAIETLANELATAIQNAQLYKQVQRHAEEMEACVVARTAELQAAYEDLQALSCVKDEFVANVSHELRTPLTSLRLYHHLLVERPDKQAQYMATLRRETARLEHIVEDLLYLSRLDRGEVMPALTPLDLNALAETLVADRSVIATATGLELTLNKEPNLPQVRADQMLLERVMGILIENSLSYTPFGGHITVTTQARESDGVPWVGFTISNDGPAIPPDELPRLFERFFRGRTGRQSGVPGTGLGLAIAKEIVTRHGGTITAESGLDGTDRGVAFHVWLPVVEE